MVDTFVQTTLDKTEMKMCRRAVVSILMEMLSKRIFHQNDKWNLRKRNLAWIPHVQTIRFSSIAYKKSIESKISHTKNARICLHTFIEIPGTDENQLTKAGSITYLIPMAKRVNVWNESHTNFNDSDNRIIFFNFKICIIKYHFVIFFFYSFYVSWDNLVSLCTTLSQLDT